MARRRGAKGRQLGIPLQVRVRVPGERLPAAIRPEYKHLTDEQVRELRRRKLAGATYGEVAHWAHLPKLTVERAVRGVTFARVTDPGPVATRPYAKRAPRAREPVRVPGAPEVVSDPPRETFSKCVEIRVRWPAGSDANFSKLDRQRRVREWRDVVSLSDLSLGEHTVQLYSLGPRWKGSGPRAVVRFRRSWRPDGES
jgi:hypothetical protein